MLSDHIQGLGLNQSDMFRSARHGHVTPYQAASKMAMDGSPFAPSNPMMESVNTDYPKLKDIKDVPKTKSVAILTQRGKYIVAFLIVAGAAYLIWKKHKANQMQPQQPQAQPVEQHNNGGAITEPPAPNQGPQIVDNSPSAANISSNPQ